MILYHAISSYQLLCVIAHRLLFQAGKKAILVLPDFIVWKYPQYLRLVELGLFNEVYLFPYLEIAHNKDTVRERVSACYASLIPYDIEAFDEIFAAGAHYYFSLYLIDKRVPFHFFEDASGMLTRLDSIYHNLQKTFPVQAEIAKENGLFDGNNPFVIDIYCRKAGQGNKKYIEFNLNQWLLSLRKKDKKKILDFFGLARIKVRKASSVFLTQQFANLGIMTGEQQRHLVETVVAQLQKKGPVIVKRHPDDIEAYAFQGDVKVISEVFPVELLQFVLHPIPQSIVTISSTGINDLKGVFKNTFSYAEAYSDRYDFEDEYTSMINIILKEKEYV